MLWFETLVFGAVQNCQFTKWWGFDGMNKNRSNFSSCSTNASSGLSNRSMPSGLLCMEVIRGTTFNFTLRRYVQNQCQ